MKKISCLLLFASCSLFTGAPVVAAQNHLKVCMQQSPLTVVEKAIYVANAIARSGDHATGANNLDSPEEKKYIEDFARKVIEQDLVDHETSSMQTSAMTIAYSKVQTLIDVCSLTDEDVNNLIYNSCDREIFISDDFLARLCVSGSKASLTNP